MPAKGGFKFEEDVYYYGWEIKIFELLQNVSKSQ